MTADVLHFRQSQTQRLARFGVTASVDMHCHCLPGIDDGPPTLANAITLCRALVEDGITTVITTPHQLGPYENVTASVIRAAVASLQAELAKLGIPLVVKCGAEIRADERLLPMLAADELLTLGDGHAYALIELPHSTMLDLRSTIDILVGQGITPIISHPERHGPISRDIQLLAPWLQRGAILQVTAASLTGVFGPIVKRSAWELMNAGWVSLVASDAHDVAARSPSMTAAIEAVAATTGHAMARRVCLQHPQAVLEGKPIMRPRVAMVQRRGRS